MRTFLDEDGCGTKNIAWATTGIVYAVFCLLLLLFGSGAANAEDREREMKLESFDKIAGGSRQLLVVLPGINPAVPVEKLYALEKEHGFWVNRFGPVPVTIGRNGFAPAGEKREGDGKTPSGIYGLGIVFGYADTAETKMPYRQMTKDDIWVDDPSAPDYNRLTKRGETRAKSFEDMVLADDRYKYGIVVRYNMDPVVPGMGSAIFVHVWKEYGYATSGCVAMTVEDIRKILKWLDPTKKPMIILNQRPSFLRD